MANRGWIPLVWPVPSSRIITQKFGANYSTYARFGWTIGHSGLDIRTRTTAFPTGIGTPIVAAQGGVVNHAGDHFYPDGRATGYGRTVIIDHPDGTKTLYAHNSRVRVRAGQRVTAGQRIADAGTSGNSSGPHCHFELWQPPFNVSGVWGRVNPTYYFEEIKFGRFGIRALDGEEEEEADFIYIERNLHDPLCACPPFIPTP